MQMEKQMEQRRQREAEINERVFREKEHTRLREVQTSDARVDVLRRRGQTSQEEMERHLEEEYAHVC